MEPIVVRHRCACDGFARIAHAIAPGTWGAPTPCAEWTARDVVEHVIGFHEFLLLRPLGVRAHRPKDGAALRFDATAEALFRALAAPGALDRVVELPGGGSNRPRDALDALTTEVLVPSWDLARAGAVTATVDAELCERALAAARARDFRRDPGMIGPERPVAGSAPAADRLAAFYGRDPGWAP